MTHRPAPRLVGVGAIFIDDIVLPDGTTYMGQLGGGVVHALMGAALWGEKPGLVALAGRDLPDGIQQRLERHLDTRGLCELDLPQIRAWQIFEHDGTRRELYRVRVTEPFIRGAQSQHFPQDYQSSQGFYLLQDFDGVCAWASVLKGLVFWEPLQQIMVAGNRDRLRTALQSCQISVVSPNLAEAQAVYELKDAEALAAAFLEDGAETIALRMGPEGSLIASRQSNQFSWIPVVHVPAIVDQTGAGNTYCGGMLAGLLEGKSSREAALMGAVAASFCIEQQGVLDPGLVSQVERDRRYQLVSR